MEDARNGESQPGQDQQAIGAISDMAAQIAAAAEEQTSVTGESAATPKYPPRLPGAGGPGRRAARGPAQVLTGRLEQEIGRFRL